MRLLTPPLCLAGFTAALPLCAIAQPVQMPGQPPVPHITDAAVGYAHAQAVPITIHVSYAGPLTHASLQPAMDALKSNGGSDASATVTPGGAEVSATLPATANLPAVVLALRNAAVRQSIVRVSATARYSNCFAAQQEAMANAVGIARQRAVRAAQLMGVHLGQPLSMTINPGETRDRNDTCVAFANLPLEPGAQTGGPRDFPSIWVQVDMTFAISK